MTASPRTRFLWLAGGIVAFGLGLVGIPLPHRRFGPMIADWREKGAISKRAKIYSVATMIAAPLASVFVGVPTWALIAQIVCLMGAATFVLTRPSG